MDSFGHLREIGSDLPKWTADFICYCIGKLDTQMSLRVWSVAKGESAFSDNIRINCLIQVIYVSSWLNRLAVSEAIYSLKSRFHLQV